MEQMQEMFEQKLRQMAQKSKEIVHESIREHLKQEPVSIPIPQTVPFNQQTTPKRPPVYNPPSKPQSLNDTMETVKDEHAFIT
jgi:hypothetical protein